MSDLFWAASVFVSLCASAGLGRVLLTRLPEGHRSRESLEFTRVTSGLLVTFTALVLSLLLASVNASFEKTGNDLQTYSAQIIRLTADLEDYGPATSPMRATLRAYAASMIKSTWPDEPAPPGTYPDAVTQGTDFDASNLGDMLRQIEAGIRGLDPASRVETDLRARSLTRLESLQDQRWVLIGEAHRAITLPFYHVMLLWLVVVFLSFGLSAPRNGLALLFVVMVAISVAGSIFVIAELDGPLDGLIKVSSAPMRHALRHLDESLQVSAQPPPT